MHPTGPTFVEATNRPPLLPTLSHGVIFIEDNDNYPAIKTNGTMHLKAQHRSINIGLVSNNSNSRNNNNNASSSSAVGVPLLEETEDTRSMSIVVDGGSPFEPVTTTTTVSARTISGDSSSSSTFLGVAFAKSTSPASMVSNTSFRSSAMDVDHERSVSFTSDQHLLHQQTQSFNNNSTVNNQQTNSTSSSWQQQASSHHYFNDSPMLKAGRASGASSKTSMNARNIENMIEQELRPLTERSKRKQHPQCSSVDLGTIRRAVEIENGGGSKRLSAKSVSSSVSSSSSNDLVDNCTHISSLAFEQNLKMKMFLENADQKMHGTIQSSRPRLEGNQTNHLMMEIEEMKMNQQNQQPASAFFDDIDRDIEEKIKKARSISKDYTSFLPSMPCASKGGSSSSEENLKSKKMFQPSRRELDESFSYREPVPGEYLNIPMNRYVELRMKALMEDSHAVEALEQRIEQFKEKKERELKELNEEDQSDEQRRINYVSRNIQVLSNYQEHLREQERLRSMTQDERYHNMLIKRRRQQKISLEKQLLLLDTPESKKLVLLYQTQQLWLTLLKFVQASHAFRDIALAAASVRRMREEVVRHRFLCDFVRKRVIPIVHRRRVNRARRAWRVLKAVWKMVAVHFPVRKRHQSAGIVRNFLMVARLNQMAIAFRMNMKKALRAKRRKERDEERARKDEERSEEEEEEEEEEDEIQKLLPKIWNLIRQVRETKVVSWNKEDRMPSLRKPGSFRLQQQQQSTTSSESNAASDLTNLVSKVATMQTIKRAAKKFKVARVDVSKRSSVLPHLVTTPQTVTSTTSASSSAAAAAAAATVLGMDSFASPMSTTTVTSTTTTAPMSAVQSPMYNYFPSASIASMSAMQTPSTTTTTTTATATTATTKMVMGKPFNAVMTARQRQFRVSFDQYNNSNARRK